MKISNKLKKHLVHLGVHFSVTFIVAVYWIIYCLSTGISMLEVLVGFFLIMFSGFLLDGIDHFLGNWERVKQIILDFKQGKMGIGNAEPNRINYFHTWKFFIFYVVFLILIFIFWSKLLAMLSFATYFIHMFLIDSFNNENTWCPSNPVPTDIYNFLYPRSEVFRKLCWGKREKEEGD